MKKILAIIMVFMAICLSGQDYIRSTAPRLENKVFWYDTVSDTMGFSGLAVTPSALFAIPNGNNSAWVIDQSPREVSYEFEGEYLVMITKTTSTIETTKNGLKSKITTIDTERKQVYKLPEPSTEAIQGYGNQLMPYNGGSWITSPDFINLGNSGEIIKWNGSTWVPSKDEFNVPSDIKTN